MFLNHHRLLTSGWKTRYSRYSRYSNSRSQNSNLMSHCLILTNFKFEFTIAANNQTPKSLRHTPRKFDHKFCHR